MALVGGGYMRIAAKFVHAALNDPRMISRTLAAMSNPVLSPLIWQTAAYRANPTAESISVACSSSKKVSTASLSER